ncbi:hypothetical protein COCOR_05844 [Corallococcus coralloides DSM 2259]|uniref:DUF6321 domain-containing protein n=1 Tax=Corallococcus coralloides (strain ATCC 25202 / DSM 2259 / NBRC 100086 / M2) TaxID=1144275 RepID=H8MH11_CORCM|nr:DUF6321 domain-containing protein [Corallococcus coralloides]AFE06611.1 hypothetical protein COCOR_05844 [Corallococcus coralloides DSM 2259]
MPTRSPTRKSVTRTRRLKDPKGGLTAAGREWFHEKEGANLKPGVKGKADTPEKMRRKGSFLRRHFAHPRGPMVDDQGKPTRLALSARAWGEPVPKDNAGAKRLATKGTKLLERYHASQERAKPAAKRSGAKKTRTAVAARRATAKKRAPVTARKTATRKRAKKS